MVSPDEASEIACLIILHAVVGDEIWDQQARLRIRMGPLSKTQYDSLLPSGAAYPLLKTIARFFSHDQFDVEVQLVLEAGAVAPCRLGADDAPAPILGWGTWLRTAGFARAAAETVLTL